MLHRGVQPIDGGGLGIDRPDELCRNDDEFDAYRKRMMLAYRFRPNPMVSIDLLVEIFHHFLHLFLCRITLGGHIISHFVHFFCTYDVKILLDLLSFYPNFLFEAFF